MSQSNEELEAKIVSGALWEEFCDSLKSVGKQLLTEGLPQDPFSQAEGMRYLTRLTRGGLENFVEGLGAEYPTLRRGAHETIKLGGDNPDNIYEGCSVSGEYDYKISGTRGTVHYLSFGTHAGNYGQGKRLETTGSLDAKDMEIAEDGTFEIIVSKTKKPGNWLPMAEDSSSVVVRQSQGDRKTEIPANLKVERLGADGQAPAPLDPVHFANSLQRVPMFLQGTVGLFLSWTQNFMAQPRNTFEMLDPDTATFVGGDPKIRYFYGIFEFDQDEALVIETDIPECDYWNIQLNNVWMESLEYRYNQIDLNQTTSELEPDGSVRIVVAHKDPGVKNWVTTAGHDTGVLMWRWVGATEHPVPPVRRVKIADL